MDFEVLREQNRQSPRGKKAREQMSRLVDSAQRGNAKSREVDEGDGKGAEGNQVVSNRGLSKPSSNGSNVRC